MGNVFGVLPAFDEFCLTLFAFSSPDEISCAPVGALGRSSEILVGVSESGQSQLGLNRISCRLERILEVSNGRM